MWINPENLVFFYMAICLALLAFNIVYIFQDKESNKRINRETRVWTEKLLADIRNDTWGGVNGQEQKKLRKKLKRTRHLVAFHQAVQKLLDCGLEKEMLAYLKELRPVFQYLAMEYGKKDQITKAYYAYLMSIYRISEGMPYDNLMEILISYMEDSVIYCRENVLRALYGTGNVEAVEKAILILNREHKFHHVKLLSDGLASFRGNREELAERLWSHYGELNENLSVAVIQFITQVSGTEAFSKDFLKLLLAEDTDLESRLSVVRYFRKHRYEPARQILQSFLNSSAEVYWELTALSAAALESYPGDDTVEALTKALHDANWYVRHNAAASLTRMEVSREKLNEILEGEDRYAREMLQYMLK